MLGFINDALSQNRQIGQQILVVKNSDSSYSDDGTDSLLKVGDKSLKEVLFAIKITAAGVLSSAASSGFSIDADGHIKLAAIKLTTDDRFIVCVLK